MRDERRRGRIKGAGGIIGGTDTLAIRNVEKR